MANVTSLTASRASLTAAFSILAARHKAPTVVRAREPNQSYLAVNGYCWMHGYCIKKEGHDSATCKDKAEGHKDGATHANTMNGSKNNNKGWDT